MDLKVTFILGWDDFKPRRNTPNPFLNHSIVIAYFPCADYFNSLIILNKYYRKKKNFTIGHAKNLFLHLFLKI